MSLYMTLFLLFASAILFAMLCLLLVTANFLANHVMVLALGLGLLLLWHLCVLLTDVGNSCMKIKCSCGDCGG